MSSFPPGPKRTAWYINLRRCLLSSLGARPGSFRDLNVPTRVGIVDCAWTISYSPFSEWTLLLQAPKTVEPGGLVSGSPCSWSASNCSWQGRRLRVRPPEVHSTACCASRRFSFHSSEAFLPTSGCFAALLLIELRGGNYGFNLRWS